MALSYAYFKATVQKKKKKKNTKDNVGNSITLGSYLAVRHQEKTVETVQF